jgi:hypothetical protein
MRKQAVKGKAAWERPREVELFADYCNFFVGFGPRFVGLVPDDDDLRVSRSRLDDAARASWTFAHNKEVRERRGSKGSHSYHGSDENFLHWMFPLLDMR